MKTKLLIGLFIFAMMLGACSKTAVKKSMSRNDKLLARINMFHTSLIFDKDFEKADSIVAERMKQNLKFYVNSFKEGEHMTQYYSVDYAVVEIEPKGNMARAVTRYDVKAAKDSEIISAVMYNFWEYENDNWFLMHRAIDFFDTPKKWSNPLVN
ncbi:hypothetical protein ACFL2A_00945 [Thermodesulfobacteriota bacterium]